MEFGLGFADLNGVGVTMLEAFRRGTDLGMPDLDKTPDHVDRVLSKPPKLQDLRTALSECCERELRLRRA